MCTEVQEGLAATRMDLEVVVEPEKPWALFGCSTLTL
jgi:nicotinamide riboside kinase